MFFRRAAMAATFTRHGLQFQYPENWQLKAEDTEDGWSVTVQAPDGGAFLLLSSHAGHPPVTQMLETALAALREDYPELEAVAATESLAGQRAQGWDVQFLSLDFVTTCWLRSWRTKTHSLLLMCQCSDLDSAHAEPVLRAIRASLRAI
jgi:hypothetical protein